MGYQVGSSKQDKPYERDIRMVLKIGKDGLQGDGRCLSYRVAVGPCADGRKRHALYPMMRRDLQAVKIGTRKQDWRSGRVVVIDRPNGVYHPLGRQRPSRGDTGFADRTPTNAATFLEKRRPASAVDRSINAASATKPGVGGVDNRINVLLGDISLHEFEQGMAYLHLHVFAPIARTIRYRYNCSSA